MAAQQHQIQLSLPPKALEEMRQMAHDRLLQEATADIPSPRGAAELFNFHEAAAADDGAGDTVRSNDGVVEVSVCIILCQFNHHTVKYVLI